MLCLLVSIGFQVLFHSPPGVLFTFPSRYYTLSVTRSYLALGDGPPAFPPDSSCPVVLRIPPVELEFRLQDCHFLWCGFLSASSILVQYLNAVHTPSHISMLGFGLFPVRSPLLRKSFLYFLFLRVLRCFSSPGSPPHTIYSCADTVELPTVSSLIRKSTDYRSFATTRSLSQLVTSFFGA